jgi:20S proteasome alpha/beta subunit
MTIAAGFMCKDGILICGDREEAAGNSKRSTQKVFTLMAQPWCLVVATAGDSAVGDLALKRLQQGFVASGTEENVERDHEQIIIDVLTKLYEDHVWKNTRADHRIRLVIGLTFMNRNSKYLYVTEDNIPQPVTKYCAVGYGEDLCTYFTERLYHSDLSANELILLATFIFREVNAAVQFCGKGTDMAFLRPRGLSTSIYPQGVELIQAKLPEFSQTMATFWESLANLPGWIRAIGKASHKTQEENL